MQKRLKAIVTGNVQGVMFRDFTQRKASSFGLTGFVKNQDDGSVLIIAEGEDKVLQKLVEKLWERPFLTRVAAKVEDIRAEYSEATGEYSKFVIDYGY